MTTNHGPQFPPQDRVVSVHLRTLHPRGVVHTQWLDHARSELVVHFRRMGNKHDTVFVKNFWRTLNVEPSPHPPLAFKILQVKKSEVDSHVNPSQKDHSRVRIRSRWYPLKNYKLEAPHIFVGRGIHPMRGTCKFDLKTQDITLNTFGDREFTSHVFSRCVHEPNANWSARWCDPITKQFRYSTLQKHDISKFDIARHLKRNLHRLHRRNEEFSRKNTQCRQLALACHFIEKFGIRVGNEKNTVLAADTVGCCTLKKNVHIRIVDSEKRLVKMDFHGKDDVHFKKKSTIDALYFEILKEMFRRNETALLFDLINPTKINHYLGSIVPGLTAKVFRTYKASNVFQNTLNKTHDLKLANLRAARVCNHRTSKGDNLQTSRNNYIDPRIYFAYVNAQPHRAVRKWFEYADWAKHTDKCFVF